MKRLTAFELRSDTGPLSVNREPISGAPTHSTGEIMQPTLERHFGSGASHLRNVAPQR